MTVYVAHAPADREVAEGLERLLERRGQFVELEDGETAPRPLQFADAVVALISKETPFSPTRLRFEQRALDAWAEGRLVLIKLDQHIPPVGLRDLPAVDASFVARREFTWNEVATLVQEKLSRPPALQAEESAPDEAQPPPPLKKKRRGPGLLTSLALMIPGVMALAATGSIWLANRIGPVPGDFDDLRAGIDALGAHYWLPAGVAEWLFIAAWGLMAYALVNLIGLARQPKAVQPAPAQDALFVSYARANAAQVLPVIDGAAQGGGKFWLDREGIGAGENWAAQIVRAIRGAPGVMVMCSQAAFESDHVKREVYLADRYHKRLFPVFIEEAAPPEDFEYFFADVQPLNLFETPEAERSEALLRVLGAPS